MQVSFANEYLEKLYHQQKLSGKAKYDKTVVEVYIRRIDQFIAAENSNELWQFKSLHVEALKGRARNGDKQGRSDVRLYSVRVNQQYRIEFRLNDDVGEQIEIVKIEDVSNHYR